MRKGMEVRIDEGLIERGKAVNGGRFWDYDEWDDLANVLLADHISHLEGKEASTGTLLAKDSWAQMSENKNEKFRTFDTSLHSGKNEEAQVAIQVEEAFHPTLRLVRPEGSTRRWAGDTEEDKDLLLDIWGAILFTGQEDAFREKAAAYQEGICIEWLE